MSTVNRLVPTVCAALLSVALLLPAHAYATEEPTALADLATAATAASISESRAVNSLAWVDARLADARARLSSVNERLPENSSEQAIAVIQAIGAAFVPALADETDALAADRRARDELVAEIAGLEKQRAAEEVALSRARQRNVDAQSALDSVQDQQAGAGVAAQASPTGAAGAQAQLRAAYGVFPVAGPNNYVDSWGFRRSGGRRHKGTDIMAAAGTPVVAVKDGVVTAGSNRLGGIILWLQAADGTRYYYAHLSSIAVPNGPVTAGQVIGAVGTTGNARGGAPHLHFEVHHPGAVDPYPILRQMGA